MQRFNRITIFSRVYFFISMNCALNVIKEDLKDLLGKIIFYLLRYMFEKLALLLLGRYFLKNVDFLLTFLVLKFAMMNFI